MKIGDIKRNGNVVRFFLVADKCTDYTGDDWDDRPYEHNAGPIYDEYVTGHIDIAFSLDYCLKEAADNYVNSPYRKNDFKKNRAVPLTLYKVDEDGHETEIMDFNYNDPADVVVTCEYGKVIECIIKEPQDYMRLFK